MREQEEMIFAATDTRYYRKGSLIGRIQNGQFLLEINPGESVWIAIQRLLLIRERIGACVSIYPDLSHPMNMACLRMRLDELSGMANGHYPVVAVAALLPNPVTGRHDHIFPQAQEMAIRWIYEAVRKVAPQLKEVSFYDLQFEFRGEMPVLDYPESRQLGFMVCYREERWVFRVLLERQGFQWMILDCAVLAHNRQEDQTTFTMWRWKNGQFSCYHSQSLPVGACWTKAYIEGFIAGERCPWHDL